MFYTYLIGWSKLNLFYYGVRISKKSKLDDLFKVYFTSSKYVHEIYSKNGMPDVIEIRKIFNDKYQALKWEHKVLRRMKVIINEKFINKSDNKLICPIAALKGSKSKKNNKKLSNALRKYYSSKMKELNKVYGIQYQSEERRKLANKKSIDTKKRNASEGKYKELYSNHSKNLKGKFTKKSGAKNSGWFDCEIGKRMATKNNSIAICPHCKKEGQYRAMKRWHYDNCKNKIE